ncbi:MAG: phosphotransferase family protein [Pseudomonadota bacterium]
MIEQPSSPDADAASEVDLPSEVLDRYLSDHIGGLTPPLDWRRFSGGQSNPTYSASGPARSVVLRRKPFGPLLPSAHAIDREARVMSALAKTTVPVPPILHYCGDDAVIGAPFYVMGHVEGQVFFDTRLPALSIPARTALYHALIDTLAALHSVDVAAVGLGDFGKPAGYVARQAARWARQYRASQTDDLPAMDWLIDHLPGSVAEIPDETCLVHGDYRLDNVIWTGLAEALPQVAAVLDWELSTLGHPLADLAYFLMTWVFPSDLRWGLRDVDHAASGIPTMQGLAARYAAATGRSALPDLDLLIAYNAFRMAAIIQGVYRRGLDGNAADAAALGMGGDVVRLADVALLYARRAIGGAAPGSWADGAA